MDVWEFFESLESDSRGDLSEVELNVAAICDLRQAVNSGGLESYFWNSGGNTAQRAIGPLGDVLGNEWADLLRRAMSLFGATYPSDIDDRQRLLEDNEELEDALDEMDTEYQDLEAAADADALLTQHLNS